MLESDGEIIPNNNEEEKDLGNNNVTDYHDKNNWIIDSDRSKYWNRFNQS